MLYHLKELVELSRMPPKLALGKIFEPRYRRLKSKNHRGDQALFWGEKFEYANNTSFERALRVESNDTKINEI
uniref:Uncharacterized protein n=1 Tax=Meloidogyne incognita TaxID=6306 RepID=A0A914KGT4_MELIC